MELLKISIFIVILTIVLFFIDKFEREHDDI
jgi:hypothetical protein